MSKPDANALLAAHGRAAVWASTHDEGCITPFEPASDATSVPVLVHLADVEPQPVRWLWPGRLPLGKLVVLDGDPGRGKSLLTLDISARVSCGPEMPSGERADLSEPAGVVILSAEDDIADSIKPRLEAAGADCRRIASLTAVREEGGVGRERSVTLSDVGPLEAAIRRVEAALVIIDPIMAYVGSATDAHRDSDIRGLLSPLAALASSSGATILGVRHLRKSGATSATHAGGGSIGIIGAARVGLIVANDPDDESRRVLAVAKCNLGPEVPALTYRIATDGRGLPRVEWGGETHRTADELVRPRDLSRAEDAASAVDDAEALLRRELAAGPRPIPEIEAVARREGISDRTLRRARERLGIRGKYGDPSWTWALPPDPKPPAEGNT